MLNITISNSDPIYREKTITVINRVLVNYDIDYRIHKFSGLNNKKEYDNIFKIYILDVSFDTKMKTVNKIRENDLDSIIILITNCEEVCHRAIHDKIMAFEVICKDSNYDNELSKVIKLAVDIYLRHKVFIFSYNHVIYRISYSEITYIEKEPLIKRCIIHTINNDYYVVNSIENLKRVLGSGFIKTHQSCIVNVSNIREFDVMNSLIIFKNGARTHLITNKMKRAMKEYIMIHR